MHIRRRSLGGPAAAARRQYSAVSHACHYWRLMAASFTTDQWDVTANATLHCNPFAISLIDAGPILFLKSFNSIFGKIGRRASEEVLFELIKSKCLPILLYGTDVCPMKSADRQSLQFTINKIVLSLESHTEYAAYRQRLGYRGFRIM